MIIKDRNRFTSENRIYIRKENILDLINTHLKHDLTSEEADIWGERIYDNSVGTVIDPLGANSNCPDNRVKVKFDAGLVLTIKVRYIDFFVTEGNEYKHTEHLLPGRKVRLNPDMKTAVDIKTTNYIEDTGYVVANMNLKNKTINRIYTVLVKFKRKFSDKNVNLNMYYYELIPEDEVITLKEYHLSDNSKYYVFEGERNKKLEEDVIFNKQTVTKMITWDDEKRKKVLEKINENN